VRLEKGPAMPPLLSLIMQASGRGYPLSLAFCVEVLEKKRLGMCDSFPWEGGGRGLWDII
jgi:hypothetical protein